MTIYTLYGLTFLSLSGLGVVYLNPESILALCFFVFFGLILSYGDAAGHGLSSARSASRELLVGCMLESRARTSALSVVDLWQKEQLMVSLKTL